jgi:hypothetical protein
MRIRPTKETRQEATYLKREAVQTNRASSERVELQLGDLRASPLTVVDHRGKAAKRSILLIVIMMCRTIGAPVHATMLSV